jgi:ATP-dependent Lon protease
VLPIGGVKEKVLAARQAKIKAIILPKLNKRDVLAISSRMLHDLTFRYVETVDEVLDIALLPPGSAERVAHPGEQASGPAREIRVTPEVTQPHAPRA